MHGCAFIGCEKDTAHRNDLHPSFPTDSCLDAGAGRHFSGRLDVYVYRPSRHWSNDLLQHDFHDLKSAALSHLKIGFPMGFQMSVMRTLWIASIFLNFRVTSLISNIFENILEKLSKILPIKSFSFV